MPRGLSGKANGRWNGGHTAQPYYNAWQNMKARCLRSNHPKYHRYGGRGISICQEWMDINVFGSWAFENGFVKGMSIDRINLEGNYCPDNCRVISVSENSRKKRTTKISLIDAQEIRERLSLGENEYVIADEYGVVHGTIWFIKKGFTHVAEGECAKAIAGRKSRKQ